MSIVSCLCNEVSIGEDGERLLSKCYHLGQAIVRDTINYNALDGRHEKGLVVQASAHKRMYAMYKYVLENDVVTVLYGATLFMGPNSKVVRAIARGRLRKAPQFFDVPVDVWTHSRHSSIQKAARAFGVKGARIDKAPPALQCGGCLRRITGAWDPNAGTWLPKEGVGCTCCD
jgi:hypothetical protein